MYPYCCIRSKNYGKNSEIHKMLFDVKTEKPQKPVYSGLNVVYRLAFIGFGFFDPKLTLD